MPKPRVYELARELGLSSQEIIEKLKAMGIDAKAPSSSVDEDQATKFKRHVRLESQSARKSRVYGSEEDEGERDTLEKEREARVAAERAEREHAAKEAEKEKAARKAGIRPKPSAPPAPAAPPVVRLAPRVAVKAPEAPVEPVVERVEPPPPVAAAPVAPPAPAPTPVRDEVQISRTPVTVAPIGKPRKAAPPAETPGTSVDEPADVSDAVARDGSDARPDDEISDGVPAVGPSAAPVSSFTVAVHVPPKRRPVGAAVSIVTLGPSGTAAVGADTDENDE